MKTADSRGFGPVQAWRRIKEDLDVVREKDPAVHSRVEVLLYPHIHALWTYRVAHWFYVRDHTFTARALSMAARWASGIEIHPGAVIGRRFFIDHGSAVVIGETVEIGDDVMLYHQVTLGSVGWWRDRQRPAHARRHPLVEDGVIIGTNVSVLGPVTLGARSQIGAHAVVLESVPADSKISTQIPPLRMSKLVRPAGRHSEPTDPSPFPHGDPTTIEDKDHSMAVTPQRVIVTSAPPNPNGDLHLGHLSGPFLGADVLSRYLRQRGHDVSYVGYSDDYSCYVPRRGGELGISAHQTAHLFGQRITQTLSLANMSHDYFTHALHEPIHSETVQRFFGRLWETDSFEVSELPTYWCGDCERYLYEAEMRGLCQHCAAPADGFYCEECGRPQETTGLVDATCNRCKGKPEIRQLRRIVFPLENYRERLREYYKDRPMRPRLRAYLDDMLSRPLPATTVSRQADYGIPVPLDGWEGHILDTWYSGAWGYVAASRAYASAMGEPDGLEAWTDPETRVYEFIGFDCSFSHALLWPALFLAHGGIALPEQVVINEFYRLEGGKFSTSRNHAIWGNEFLRRVPADQLRFYLCLTGPERAQTNFLATDFRETVNHILVDKLQVWLERATGLVNEDFAGRVPTGAADAASELSKHADTLPGRVAATLEPDALSPRATAEILREIIEFGHDAVAELDTLRAAGAEDYPIALAEHMELIARLAAAAAPIMPSFAQHVWTALGLEFADPVRKLLPWPGDATAPLLPGRKIAPGVPKLFQAVES